MDVHRTFLPSIVAAALVLDSPKLTQEPTEAGGKAGYGTLMKAPNPFDVAPPEIICDHDCSASKPSPPDGMPEDTSPITSDPD